MDINQIYYLITTYQLNQEKNSEGQHSTLDRPDGFDHCHFCVVVTQIPGILSFATLSNSYSVASLKPFHLYCDLIGSKLTQKEFILEHDFADRFMPVK